MTKPVLYEEDGAERELPTKWVICHQCRGHGKSSAYLGAFTRNQMNDMGDDWRDGYIAGQYDRTCERCGGTGKIEVLDRARVSKEDLEEFDRLEAEEAECREEERMERLMEGGWREEGWFDQ